MSNKNILFSESKSTNLQTTQHEKKKSYISEIIVIFLRN